MRGLKLALVSHVLPPSWSGQAMVLHRLLWGIKSDRYCLISRQHYDPEKKTREQETRLPAKYYHLPPEAQLATGQRFGVGRVTASINPWLRTYLRARRIFSIMRQEDCSAVIACTGDLIDPPSAFLASRWASVPFYLHAFDDYSYQWSQAAMRSFAIRVERIIAKGEANFIVPNEFMRDEYARRYGVEPVLVRNPSFYSETNSGPSISWPAHAGSIRIVYTGAVYHANYDAFRNLITALEMMNRPDLAVRIYSAQSQEQLEKERIKGPVVVLDHLTPAEARTVQQHADILFLPLAFESPIQEVVRTSAPGKMGEYLASKRPILVHAPVDSYVSWYFKKHDCGIVVDQNRPEELLAGIRSIIEDRGLRTRVIKNASAAAERDFSLSAARAVYWELFDTD